jgi:hypothetical protein
VRSTAALDVGTLAIRSIVRSARDVRVLNLWSGLAELARRVSLRHRVDVTFVATVPPARLPLVRREAVENVSFVWSSQRRGLGR